MAKAPTLGPDATFVFAVTGLILAVPSALLPFVGAGKLGNVRMSHLLTGVGALWENGMQEVALLVLLCGGLLPVALLAVLAALHLPARFRWRSPVAGELARAAHILEHWSIPEVQVLAVLVALMKLGSVVDVSVGPGFWCYCGVAVSLIVAEHSFDFDTTSPFPTAAEEEAEGIP